MVKRLSLFFGVFLTVLIQFCYCGPNSEEEYKNLLEFNYANCNGRIYKPMGVGKIMENVCKEYFYGQKPTRRNKKLTWMKKLDVLPKEDFPGYRLSRPYYMIIPSEYQSQTASGTRGKILKYLLAFLKN